MAEEESNKLSELKDVVNQEESTEKPVDAIEENPEPETPLTGKGGTRVG
jgi:hypothetical protein